MVIAKNIHKYYGEVEVLKGVNLEIKKAFDYAVNSKFPKQKDAFEGEYAIK